MENFWWYLINIGAGIVGGLLSFVIVYLFHEEPWKKEKLGKIRGQLRLK